MSRSQRRETTTDLRRCTYGGSGVCASRRATGNAAAGVHLDVARYGLGTCNSRTVGLSILERPFIDAVINLSEVVDAGICLRSSAGADEVGNRNRRQQSDDGNDNHDFNQCEAHFASGLG